MAGTGVKLKSRSVEQRALSVKAIFQPSLPAVILQSLREKVFNGDFPPGARIVETRLSKELGVGQPAVREALLMLERQGLARRVPNLGTFVRELNVEEVKNLFEIRSEMEGLAAERAAGRASKEDIADLRRLAENLDGVKDAKRASSRWEHFQRDLAFHQRLWMLSGNRQLAEILETVVVPLFHYGFWHHERTSEQIAKSVERHLSMVKGIETSPRSARAAVQTSIRQFSEPYLVHVYGSR